MYDVHLSENAQRFLDKLQEDIKERIIERLTNLKENPIPSDAKFIGRDNANDKIFRYRIGNFRALYKLKENEKIILISKIDRRDKVYDKY